MQHDLHTLCETTGSWKKQEKKKTSHLIFPLATAFFPFLSNSIKNLSLSLSLSPTLPAACKGVLLVTRSWTSSEAPLPKKYWTISLGIADIYKWGRFTNTHNTHAESNVISFQPTSDNQLMTHLCPLKAARSSGVRPASHKSHVNWSFTTAGTSLNIYVHVCPNVTRNFFYDPRPGVDTSPAYKEVSIYKITCSADFLIIWPKHRQHGNIRQQKVVQERKQIQRQPYIQSHLDSSHWGRILLETNMLVNTTIMLLWWRRMATSLGIFQFHLSIVIVLFEAQWPHKLHSTYM